MKTIIKDLAALLKAVGIILGGLAIIYLIYTGWQLSSVEFGTDGFNVQFEPPPSPTAASLVFDTGTSVSHQPIDLSSTAPAKLILPTDIPPIHLGEWMIVIGQFPSIDSARNYIVPFINNGFTVEIFCRISPSDSTQTPELRAAVIGYSSEDSANNALPQVQLLNNVAYLRQSSVWCPNPVRQTDYISCNYVACE